MCRNKNQNTHRTSSDLLVYSAFQLEASTLRRIGVVRDPVSSMRNANEKARRQVASSFATTAKVLQTAVQCSKETGSRLAKIRARISSGRLAMGEGITLASDESLSSPSSAILFLPFLDFTLRPTTGGPMSSVLMVLYTSSESRGKSSSLIEGYCSASRYACWADV